MTLALWVLAACAPDGGPRGSGGESVPDDTDRVDTDAPAQTPCPDGSQPTDTEPAFCGEVPSHLLFLSIDTLRRDHVDRYGGPGLMPTLSRLADEGVTLDDLTQCSCWTFASTTCTLMGRSNVDAGFIPSLTDPKPVPASATFLAEHLGARGFWSVLVSGNPWLGALWGNGQGYTVVRGQGQGGSAWVEGREKALEELGAALDEGDADRWFVHLHATEPHPPYTPPDGYLDGLDALDPVPWDLETQPGQYDAIADWPSMSPEDQALLEAHLRVRYEGEVRVLDDRLAEALEDFEAEELLDDTLVVIWSDHGEAFWEHGWQTHAYGLYGEENDAIGLFWSKNIQPGRWTAPTEATDLVPTLLGLYGIPLPPELTGAPLGTATPDRPRFAMALARMGPVSSVRRGGWRLQFWWFDGRATLTRPGVDPEERDLYPLDDPMASELWALLKPKVKQASAALPGVPLVWPEALTP